MIAPAQMARSANTSFAGPVVHRSMAGQLADELPVDAETSSSDEASATASADDEPSADHSSFGAVLRKLIAPANSTAAPAHTTRAQTSQQKAETVDPNLLLTVSSQTAQTNPDPAPRALSISFRASFPSSDFTAPPGEAAPGTTESSSTLTKDSVTLDKPAVRSVPVQLMVPATIASPPKGDESAPKTANTTTQDLGKLIPDELSKAPSIPNHEAAIQLVATLESAPVVRVITPKPSGDRQPASPPVDLTGFTPVSPKQVLDARTTTEADPSTPDEDNPIQTVQPQTSQNQNPAPTTLAFAVRLAPQVSAAPQTGDEVQPSTPPISSVRSQTTPQNIQRQISDAVQPVSQTLGEHGEPIASGERFVKAESTPLPVQLPTSGTPQTLAKTEVRPALGTVAQRTEPASSPATAPPSSSKDFTVRIPDATSAGTNVRFVDRGGEVHVSVRTGDPELAQILRGGLNDLSGRLQHNGVQAEVWRPGSNSSPSDSQTASQNDSPDPRGFGGRRNQSGAQRDGQDQPSENKPRWVEELETSIGEPAASTGN